MQTMSTVKKDFVASHLRSQINRLWSVLSTMESENRLDHDFTNESLKEVEGSLKQIRKICNN